MTPARTLTASEAKARLGEVLGNLVSEGPVEITRNGRLVAVISAPAQTGAASAAAQADRMLALPRLAALYSAGKLTWRDIANETGASFGQLLLALAEQNLELPRVAPEKSPQQASTLEAIFRRAAMGRP